MIYTYATGPEGQLFVQGKLEPSRYCVAVVAPDQAANPYARARAVRRVMRALGRDDASVAVGGLAPPERSTTA